ncbi:LuxR C-terminal-related transcriptional regulator [Sphaerisporangium sp. TRM90804]|uniref:helix-turn-helix transcriptional regulator n=1 Tax=Sphaerisporangium sp. TRM90804 TaxID=3031113 RepID=UPI00244811D2|nr:LuxR C-terminal-related transcriptional regulator [Sphaerisporangium sp. TRM90804]MDH2429479.1 AAA family ATPase [Sphaerisporangium sp. TRM90804]
MAGESDGGGVAAVDPSLLERTEELAALRGFAAGLRDGAGLLLVEGAAGIGKTRLVREVRGMAQAAGARVLAARCTELERDFAFGAVRQLFEPIVAAGSEAESAQWWSGPAAGARSVFAYAGGDVGGTAGEFAVLHGLYWLAVNMSNDGLLLILDDLHWCDEASLRWLVYALPRIEGVPISVVAAARPGDWGGDRRLLALIGEQAVRVVRPRPLSESATGQVLAEALGETVEEGFAAAIHTQTSGNPLLVRAVARTVEAERLAPSTANVPRLLEIEGSAVEKMLRVRLAGVIPQAAVLAQAIAVLGGEADFGQAAALAGLDAESAGKAVAALINIEILQRDTPLRFVHPMVQTAVYDHLDLGARQSRHTSAARLLAAADADPERVAVQLLHTAPAGDPGTVTSLRRAAGAALRRGSPDSAHIYLRRALTEPPPDADRLGVLCDLATTTRVLNFSDAADYLSQAHRLAGDPTLRAELACGYGVALYIMGRVGQAVPAFTKALEELPPDDDDVRRRLETYLFNVPFVSVGWDHLWDRLPELRALPPADTIGARMLSSILAAHRVAAGEPEGIAEIGAALGDGLLVEEATSELATLSALWVLVTASPGDGVATATRAIARAQSQGSATALAGFHMYRALGWLSMGQLNEAETDAQESLRLVDATGSVMLEPIATAFLADALLERGEIAEAEAALRSVTLPKTGLPFYNLHVESKILSTRDQHADALDICVEAGRAATAHHQINPATVPWRSQAALSLHALGRVREAREYAGEELGLARRFGVPHSLGRALRVAGLVAEREEALPLLREAVEILAKSVARLEHARALIDLGTLHRRAGQRTQARQYLQQGADLADVCGAQPVLDRAAGELRILGARPRLTRTSGPHSLTPSELRVAEMAATGRTNREIAQALFVTPKTVEVHLTNIYRKLKVSSRRKLATALEPGRRVSHAS